MKVCIDLPWLYIGRGIAWIRFARNGYGPGIAVIRVGGPNWFLSYRQGLAPGVRVGPLFFEWLPNLR